MNSAMCTRVSAAQTPPQSTRVEDLILTDLRRAHGPPQVGVQGQAVSNSDRMKALVSGSDTTIEEPWKAS